MKIDNPFDKTEEFHRIFDNRRPSAPQAFTAKTASARAGFKAEELVEFLYSSANNDMEEFHRLVEQLKTDVDTAEKKILEKGKQIEEVLVDQVDALIDLLYFTYGSFSLLGVDPTELFTIVHEANMGKLFEDGKPRYHEVTHKVLKPDDWEEKYAPELKIKAELERQKKESR
ncbi:HAD family hydrolase [Enterococcus sp. BWB1-3]|uniref:HAD family hydrolase n=1 Tax=unclassified Enterococcus TaxID=2608891 RepID=UPI001923294D|nr:MULTISPECIES: HAD family hydrolase [unclassified Enterococcus]MBL1228870.1 HAD family hydrolase [Enterococcus sp. BWB1-3]MCB5951587.1 HAD family hydrolase [Enterococcus sp. BWT-B8]MCB5954679.1 HAD family hydrolase [Enterococcus sp. CWB-B31]